MDLWSQIVKQVQESTDNLSAGIGDLFDETINKVENTAVQFAGGQLNNATANAADAVTTANQGRPAPPPASPAPSFIDLPPLQQTGISMMTAAVGAFLIYFLIYRGK